MDTTEEFEIDFVGTSQAEAEAFAEDLRSKLLAADSSIRVERKRADTQAMDAGAILTAVLGAAATANVAKALSNWLFQNDRIALDIKVKGKEIHLQNVRREDATQLTKSLLKVFQ
jgi:hypothetical protein